MKKHEEGFDLFQSRFSVKDIAEKLKVSETAVYNWKRKYNWDEQIERETKNFESAQQGIWELVRFQIDVLNRIAQKRRDELNKPDLSIKDLQLLLISPGNTDGLHKLMANIKGKDQTWSQYITFATEFLDFLSSQPQYH